MAKLPMEIARNAGVLPNAAPGTTMNMRVALQTERDLQGVGDALAKATKEWNAVQDKIQQSRDTVELIPGMLSDSLPWWLHTHSRLRKRLRRVASRPAPMVASPKPSPTGPR